MILCFDENPRRGGAAAHEPRAGAGGHRGDPALSLPGEGYAAYDGTETMLGDQRIGPVQFIVAWIGSANRDEAEFPDPDRFDIEREPNRHVAFGRGIHFCLGAPLARLEAKVALNAMLDRLPGRWQVADVPLEMIKSFIVFGAKKLPLTWGA